MLKTLHDQYKVVLPSHFDYPKFRTQPRAVLSMVEYMLNETWRRDAPANVTHCTEADLDQALGQLVPDQEAIELCTLRRPIPLWELKPEYNHKFEQLLRQHLLDLGTHFTTPGQQLRTYSVQPIATYFKQEGPVLLTCLWTRAVSRNKLCRIEEVDARTA